MQYQDIFNALATEALKNKKLNKREKEIFIDGLIQGLFATCEDVDEWGAVAVKSEEIAKRLKEL